MPEKRPPTRRAGRTSVTPKATAFLQGGPAATEDERLLERRPARPFSTPIRWRAPDLSEFVEGFDAMAHVGRR
jgi:hypothetical protein